MQIYSLDNIITLSALNPYKPIWLKTDLLSYAKRITEGTDFSFDWDEKLKTGLFFFIKIIQ